MKLSVLLFFRICCFCTLSIVLGACKLIEAPPNLSTADVLRIPYEYEESVISPIVVSADVLRGARDTPYGPKSLEHLPDVLRGPYPVPDAPDFPWPPPKGSGFAEIPRTWFEIENAPTLLKDIDQRITAALEHNGYYESSYYAVPEGFALVTKMEQILPDGTPKQEPNRWVLVPQPIDDFSLAAYISALFKARPGYYRVLVFVVTPYTFEQADVEVTSDEAREWLTRGANRLPTAIGDLDFLDEDYACTALIYQFERPVEDEDPEILLPSPIDGRRHLERAGIWETLQQ